MAIPPDIRPYGQAIHQAVASGDLAKMKEMAKVATTYLSQHGNVSAALESLKIEIAKLEKKPKK